MTQYESLAMISATRNVVSESMAFCYENVHFSDGRSTNLYWVEMNKNAFSFDLSFSSQLKPLKKLVKRKNVQYAGINLGSFLLTDDKVKPQLQFYNMAMRNGEILQFPSNSRSAISINEGTLRKHNLNAKGYLKIGVNTYSWSGSYVKSNNAQLTIYGMFDIDVLQNSAKQFGYKREIDLSKNHLAADVDELLAAVEVKNGIPRIKYIGNKSIQLTDFAYILKGKQEIINRLKLGEKIVLLEVSGIKVNSSDSICSASFSLGLNESELISNLYSELTYESNSTPKPMSTDYKKSWSVILATESSFVFFINDARPKIPFQQGITVFELQNMLLERFSYSWGVVGDSGQSGKLLVSDGSSQTIVGNLHYINYNSRRPYWDGENGRPISVGLFAYEK